jgi:hypothetical protein
MATYPTSSVAYGQTSQDVTTLQNFLISQGYSIPAGATGYFGEQTKTALAQWQSAHGINSSTAGYGTNWGPKSISAASGSSGSSSGGTYINQQQQKSYPIGTASPGYNANGQPISNSSSQSSVFNNSTPYQTPTVNSSPVSNVSYAPTTYINYNTMQSVPVGTPSLGYDANGNQTQSYPQTTTTPPASSSPGAYTNQDTQQSYPIGTPSPGYDQYGNRIPTQPVISASAPKTDTSAQYADSTTIPGMDEGFQNTTVANLPPEAWTALTPTLVPGTSEYQAAMDKLDTSYFDILQQQMTASTEQEQQAAEYNWQTLKKQYQQTLGVTLSDDAMKAWDQIQGLKDQTASYFGNQNIEGSGLQAQTIDDYLRSVRAADASSRTDIQNKQTSAQQDYYTKYATPDQIQQLVQTNPSLAQQWGLVPSSDIKNAMNYNTLKAKYPTMSDEDINNAISSVLDVNGNYRSNLYQKYMTGNSAGITPGNVNVNNIVYDQYGNPISIPVTPGDIGQLDIKAAKEQYQAQNTPLASQSADYAQRMKLGSIPPTSGADSGTIAGTQFNNVTPYSSSSVPVTPTSSSPASTNSSISTPNPTLAQPVPTSSQRTASAPINTNSVNISSQNNPLGGTKTYGPNEQLPSSIADPIKAQIAAIQKSIDALNSKKVT